jgi:uncharacterized Zn finger protein
MAAQACENGLLVGTELHHGLNDATIRQLADAQSYRRGCDYFQHGHVVSIQAEANRVRAVVRGSYDYAVDLTCGNGTLDYSCDCPQGAGGAFCKHCVAACLAWLKGNVTPAEMKSRGKAKETTLADAAKVLQAEDSDTLARMMLEWAKDDERLHERLLHYAARRLSPEHGVAAARKAFDKAARVHEFVHYREAAAWAQGVDAAVGNIARLLDDGHAAAVIELCESALQKLTVAAGSIDDSDGHVGDLRNRLQDVHFRACQVAKPDPIALARRLLASELHSELNVFDGAAERYAKILGPKGLEEYRRLAGMEWEKVPLRTPKDDRAAPGRHFRITQIMESLARVSGDVEELVAVMSRDLSHACSYLRIGEAYREAGQHDKALLWAEKGLKAFPDHTDGRLREFAAEEYHRVRRHEDAMKLMWAEFSERPYIETYKTLERHAKKPENWPEWRERALIEIRRRIVKAKDQSRGQSRSHWMRPGNDHSLLVEIFLYERDIDAAWSEAQAGGCSGNLWLQLAAEREKAHPADAARVYLKQAEAAVAATQNGRYDDSVRMLLKAGAAMKRTGQSAEFVRHLDALRAKYKIKRNFIKLVEQKRKVLYP